MARFRRLYLYLLGLPKTIFFNFWYLPFKDAIRLPVVVSHRVWLMQLSGKVKIADVSTGAVKIGFGEVGIFDQHRSRTIWQVSGTMEFKGRAKIGHGNKLSVSGHLSLGHGFCITAESAIVAHQSITIGDDVLISWDALVMDTDFHHIYQANTMNRGSDDKSSPTNIPMPVTIGNKVWIGCRALILKGVKIADGVVIAAASSVTKSIDIPHAMAGGSPAQVIREGVRWEP
jgi:acetyltransferase-like isoleucine patch superfamily enzyme